MGSDHTCLARALQAAAGELAFVSEANRQGPKKSVCRQGRVGSPPGSAAEMRKIRVGLLWHSASAGNLGVGALTAANIAIVKEVAAAMGLSPEFVIFGMRESGASYIDDVENFIVDFRSLLSPRGYWRALEDIDCVLDIGAGDSFADIYGAKRFAFLWLTKMIARARGVPLLLSPQTIGPFTKPGYRPFARSALNAATAVVARDQISLDVLKELAPRAKAKLAVDVAFALPFEDRSAERHGSKIRVGVNVSGLLFSEAEQGRNRFQLGFDYASLMRRFIADMGRRSDVEVHLITHANHVSSSDDDRVVADRLAKEFPFTVRAPEFVSPSDAKSYISGLDFLTAGRMHACIAAFSSLTPVVPIAYSRKFIGLFGLLGYEALVPVRGMSEDQALDFLNDCLARRDELAKAELKGLGEVERLLDVYRGELKGLFATARERVG